MRTKRMRFILLITLVVVTSCKERNNRKEIDQEPRGTENVVYKWGQMALLATANDTENFGPRPTITSRYLSLIFVSVFDAWSVYNQKAVPVYLKGVEKRPEKEWLLKNKEIAVSYAAFQAMNEYYYLDKALFADFMEELGLDPTNESLDPTKV
jgi:hypothetical protein